MVATPNQFTSGGSYVLHAYQGSTTLIRVKNWQVEANRAPTEVNAAQARFTLMVY